VFRDWQSSLPAAIEVCAVELPGHGKRVRERLCRSIDQIVASVLPCVEQYLDAPYAFFGHSMGALIAFELTRALENGNAAPAHLFVAGRRAPHLPRRERSIDDMDESSFNNELRRLDGTPQEVLESPELMQLISPILRADFGLCDSFPSCPLPALCTPMTAMGGLQDREIARDDLAAWRQHTTGSFSVSMLAGNHFFINSSRQEILGLIVRHLAKSGILG